MQTPAYYKEGVPYDADGQPLPVLPTNRTLTPLVTDLGGGKFKFRSQSKPCYQMNLKALGMEWVTDRDDQKGVAICFATKEELKTAVGLMTGILPAPAYTEEQRHAAMLLLGGPGVLALNGGPWGMQLSVAGEGVMTLAGGIASALEGAVSRAVALLTASVAGPLVAAASTIFFSAPAGKGSDRVPGRDVTAMFALNAQMLAGKTGLNPGTTSVSLPVRGALINRNGQLALELLKTGDVVPAAVPVLAAVRDAATGLDIITLPAIAGEPSQTILVNPAPVPTGPSDTGNQDRRPTTPQHTGTTVKPVDNITVMPFPAEDTHKLYDFIYWRPDAAGTGVEPVYVMLSGPYGKTNAKGKYSGRDYNTDKAGGPILELNWKTVTIDRTGVDKVKLHTGRFGEQADNTVMIDRLEKILKGKLQITDTDKRFYSHELRELERYRNLDIKDGDVPKDIQEEQAVWNNTHTATLEDYKINEKGATSLH